MTGKTFFDNVSSMSKSSLSKISAALVSFFILAVTSSPVIAVDLPAGRQDSTTAAAAKRPLVQQKINIRKEQIENRIENLKEKLASKTAALRAKLEAFKDRKKAEIAERVNTNLNKINKKQTEQMLKHLDRMSVILDKLEARVNQGRPDIKNPGTTKTAIADARSSIASTSAAVSAQAQKDYTISVTSESRIKTDVKAQRDALHSDLLSVRKMVIASKQAVANAVRVAKSGSEASSSGSARKEGTSSGQ